MTLHKSVGLLSLWGGTEQPSGPHGRGFKGLLEQKTIDLDQGKKREARKHGVSL